MKMFIEFENGKFFAQLGMQPVSQMFDTLAEAVKEFPNAQPTHKALHDGGDFICVDCGPFVGDRHYTKLSQAGPYCIECIEGANEIEAEENSQFGVGA
jgi:hypothetical protein